MPALTASPHALVLYKRVKRPITLNIRDRDHNAKPPLESSSLINVPHSDYSVSTQIQINCSAAPTKDSVSVQTATSSENWQTIDFFEFDATEGINIHV